MVAFQGLQLTAAGPQLIDPLPGGSGTPFARLVELQGLVYLRLD
jgi:hypothetical protein